MNGRKKIGIGVGIATAIVALVLFTNVDDIVSETVSKVEVTNPLQTYEINTKQDFVCMQLYGAPSYLNYLEHQNDPDYLRQKYPEIIEEIEAYYLSAQLQRDSARGLTDTQLELLLPMLMNEWSVNPSLKNWIFDVMSGRLSPAEFALLEQFCEEKTTSISNEQQKIVSSAPENAEALGSEHTHASLLVMIHGDKFDFSMPAYQIKSSWIHFEGQDGDTIHRHAKQVPLGFLFDTLQINLTDECLITINDEYCTNNDFSLKFFINRQQVQDINEYVIQERDRILVSYSDGTFQQIEEQLDKLEKQPTIGTLDNFNSGVTQEELKATISEIDLSSASPVLGSPTAPITIVEFGDYQCERCYEWFHNTKPAIVQNYIDTGKANLVFIDLAFLGRDSPKAAQATYCAEDQSKYWEFHDLLYNSQEHIDNGWANSERLKVFAFSLGLDMDLFESCLDSGKFSKRVQFNIAEAGKQGATGTPTFFIINSGEQQKISGAQPFSVFKNVIESMIENP